MQRESRSQHKQPDAIDHLRESRKRLEKTFIDLNDDLVIPQQETVVKVVKSLESTTKAAKKVKTLDKVKPQQ